MNFEEIKVTDPEFYERINFFMNDEVIKEEEASLEDRTRSMAILASLIGSQSYEVFVKEARSALENMYLAPVEVKEIAYQSAAYLGIGKAYPFITAANGVLKDLNIELPLASQNTTTVENRIEEGEKIQVALFGDGMRGFSKGGHINRWLSGNCFGDYYTRKGLSLKEREMITFCYLAAFGGCEQQLTGHALANLKAGNAQDFLLRVISQCLPYIGYPRSLNAINCLNTAVGIMKKNKGEN